ncbi:unnamed protein product [Symbiodinium necroappetens]|uniref:Uncharacterized protein n=1 Tax=Symbiodinium necroappetens TaxID=1628268 RepID=A0A812NSU5_9DINO|nr:unnamed protein product [Symbiodinium necroappetens]
MLATKFPSQKKQDFETYKETEIVDLCFWGIYKTLPGGFVSKSALGVHFFAAHGRVARYRNCLDGTQCQACGVEHWTAGRLEGHNEWEENLYKLFSDGIQGPTLSEEPGQIHITLAGRLRSIRVYQDELERVVDRLVGEVEDLQRDPELRPWTASQQDFKKVLQSMDWKKTDSVQQDNHGTPVKVAYELGGSWEAEWHRHRDTLNVSAVIGDLLLLLPPDLCTVWRAHQAQRAVQLRAPATF